MAFFFFFFLNIIKFYWSIATLQCWVNHPCIYIYPLSFGFPSHLGHHKALSIVPLAIQEALISYVFWLCISTCFLREEHIPGDTCGSVLKVLYPVVLIHPSCHTCVRKIREAVWPEPKNIQPEVS